ncbi:Pc09g00190 [Penicillium rubens Wisconsin 54-1255]|uniref:Pc09g00190 protein n=1 Tax=Penicillium rubens (strain ATCC 28089 / DSM 1075 / NRRL 1951 / Wisconsin 54-1255) TaxID=500485 RepID=B6GWL5_PENRW|nr:Pc09g00190 [Penicillium rubens Wisconsin 54-1255]
MRRSPRTTIYLSSHYYQTRLLKSSAQFLLGFILLLLVRSQSEPAKNLNMDVQPKLKTNPADAVNQKARRRRKSLFKKASEYSSECDADIHLVLRMKKSGKIFVLAPKTKDWPLSQHQLTFSSYHFVQGINSPKGFCRALLIRTCALGPEDCSKSINAMIHVQVLRNCIPNLVDHVECYERSLPLKGPTMNSSAEM